MLKRKRGLFGYRMKHKKNMAVTVARRRSAELHSAVSQICNLRRARGSNPPRQAERFAEYNSAIRQMENLRYFAGASLRQALLHFQSSGPAHRCAFTGFF